MISVLTFSQTNENLKYFRYWFLLYYCNIYVILFMSMNLILYGSSESILLKTIKSQNSYLRGFTMILYYAT